MDINDKLYRIWEEEVDYFEEGSKKDHGKFQAT
jgi:hypothetical protein